MTITCEIKCQQLTDQSSNMIYNFFLFAKKGNQNVANFFSDRSQYKSDL